MTDVPADTIDAYRAARYRVHADPPFVFEVGAPSAELATLLAAVGHRTATFVTACNPRSEKIDAAANAARQQALEDEIRALGLPQWLAVGEDPSGSWPGEPAVLIAGLTRDAAEALGVRYEQNAIVWADVDASADVTPELVLLR